ncbi:MAG: hypothetical protein QXO69_02925 [archaeon]
MLKVSTSFSPIRMVAGSTEPVFLNVCVKNAGENTVAATVFVKVPYSLGFDRIGLDRDTRRRIAAIKPGAEKVIPIMIYGKTTIKPGNYPIGIKVQMHSDRYDKADGESMYETFLRVVE